MHLSYEQYHDFSAPLEGRVHGMYCDILGLITCAVGNLIDTRGSGYPAALVEAINWTLADGSPAPVAQVRADWQLLKADCMRFAKLHWKYALAATKCRLTEGEIDRIVKERLAINIAQMRKLYPDWDSFPADAQLAIMSMCWAVGTGWPQKFTRFAKLVKAQDWAAAAAFDDPKNPKGNWPGKIRETGNPGVVPRNQKNRFCLLNAALVKEHGLDVTQLHWPNVTPVGFTAEPSPVAVAAHAAADASQVAAADWAAKEAERMLDEGPRAGRNLLDYESES
jgi:GH24 family phage-related lysozyme (muramidase)